MKLASLFSGGKDSVYALYKAMQEHKVVCLISIISKNKESYMFHTPNIRLTRLQAKAIGLPLIQIETEGKKEEELEDLKEAIEIAKEKYRVEGVVSGAIASQYQKSRIENICKELNLSSITPLWQINEESYLNELIKKFNVIIVGIAGEGLSKDMLGKRVGITLADKIKSLDVHCLGEGGEIETMVLDAPFFKKRIEVVDSEIQAEEHSGILIIKKVGLIEK